jgi:DNA-binding CsgD family transcriptional regulator
VTEKHPEGAAAERLPADKPPRITPREKEILALIAEGLTDQEIARRLWVSRSTINTHQVHLPSGNVGTSSVYEGETAPRLALMWDHAPAFALL